MIERRLIVPIDDGAMTTYVWHPQGEGPYPVVVCYHAGPGLGDDIFSTAKRFAEEGYFAAVPDLYHRQGESITFDILELMKGPDGAELQRLMEVISKTPVPMMVGDTAALVEALRDEPVVDDGPKGCIGFCHTARTVIRVLAQLPNEFVVGAIMHPSWAATTAPDSPHLFVKDIKGEIYAGFGAADDIAPLPDQQPLIAELEKLGNRAVIEIHARGGHGFLWPGTPAYDPEGSVSAWAKTLDIFARVLKTAAASQ
jgi:carboxymethylenebutenolidase